MFVLDAGVEGGRLGKKGPRLVAAQVSRHGRRVEIRKKREARRFSDVQMFFLLLVLGRFSSATVWLGVDPPAGSGYVSFVRFVS